MIQLSDSFSLFHEKYIIGGLEPCFTLFAGPCVFEHKDLCIDVAGQVLEICENLGVQYIFKTSFDKANRTSVGSYRGNGLDSALEVFGEIKACFDIPVITDIHETWQAGPVAEMVDVLQIPAFLCRQTDLLLAAGKTGAVVNVKKGQFMAPWDMLSVVEKLQSVGCERIILTERGITHGYNSLVVDMTSLPIMRGLGVPVCFDATHSVQKPGGLGGSSGGAREFIPTLARSAVAARIDALFMEVHPDPERAMSDSATVYPLSELEELLEQLLEIHEVVHRVRF